MIRPPKIKHTLESHGLRLAVKKNLLIGMSCVALMTSFSSSSHGIVESAVEQYRVELATNNQDVELRRKLIHALQETQHFDEALAEIEVLRGQLPNDTHIDFESAFTNFEKEDFAQADVNINQFLKTNRYDEKGLTISGRIKLKTGDYASAVKDLSRVIAINPQTDHYLYRSDAYVAMGEISNAINSLRQGVAKKGKLAVFLTRIVSYQEQLGLYTQAIESLDVFIDSLGAESRTEYLVTQKADLLKKSGNQKAATEAYQRAFAQLNSRSTQVQNLASSKQLRSKLTANLPLSNNQQ